MFSIYAMRMASILHIFEYKEISFGNKDEHKREQERAFLALSPIERFYAFLRLSRRMKKFHGASPVDLEKNQNFIIERKSKDS